MTDTIQTDNRIPGHRWGMANFTLFELHFHDGIDVGAASLGAATGDADGTSADAGGDATEADGSSGSTAGKLLGVLAVVAVLVALAVGARKLLSDDLEPIEELDDLDDEI